MLPILLRAVDDGFAVIGKRRTPDPVLRVGKQVTPLRLEQVHDVQILTLRFKMRALRSQKMHMRIATEPAIFVHVRPALQLQGQLPLARFDFHSRPKRVILIPSRGIDDDIAAREPSLARTVNVGVAGLSEAKITSNILVPAIQIPVDLVVVPVRLIRDAFR